MYRNSLCAGTLYVPELNTLCGRTLYVTEHFMLRIVEHDAGVSRWGPKVKRKVCQRRARFDGIQYIHYSPIDNISPLDNIFTPRQYIHP